MDKILNINDKIESQVKYRGSVKILYIDSNTGRPKILKNHNKGDVGLFSAICRMLVGLSTAEFTPSYIQAYTAHNGEGRQILAQKIGYSSTPLLYQTDSEGNENLSEDLDKVDTIQYTFLIPLTSLLERNQDTKIKCLILYNRNNQPCATLNLNYNEEIETSLGSNILIYWKLKFTSNLEND